MGDGFDSVRFRREKRGGAAHPQGGDMAHGAGGEVLVAQAAQVFGAKGNKLGQSLDSPGGGEVGGDGVPQAAQAWVAAGRLNQAPASYAA